MSACRSFERDGRRVVHVVVGGATVDVLISGLDHFPEVVDGDEFTDQALAVLPSAPVASVGGNAANAAYALARLGCPVTLVTPVADDVYGCLLRSWLVSAGVTIVALPAIHTSVNVVATDVAGRRMSLFHPSGIETAAALDVLRGSRLEPGDTLLLAGYPHAADAVLRAWAAHAHHAGARVALDIGPAVSGFALTQLAPLLPGLDVVLANRDELAGLDPRRPSGDLAGWVASRLAGGLVLKDGARGATFHGPDGSRLHVDAVSVPTKIGTVGAGDVFNAGYLAADGPPVQRLRFAAGTAALMLRAALGVSGSPCRDDVSRLLSTIEEKP